jgi:hypothetical protein
MGLFDRFRKTNSDEPRLAKHFTRMRTSYIAAYHQAVAEARAQHEKAHVEIGIELSDKTLADANRFSKLDIFVQDGQSGGAIVVTLNDWDQFEPVVDLEDGFEVELNPGKWDNLHFQCDAEISLTPKISEWFHRWLDIDEKSGRPKDRYGIGQSVHTLWGPYADENGSWVGVDFGSAPAAAALELLDILRAEGATRIKVGTFDDYLADLQKKQSN